MLLSEDTTGMGTYVCVHHVIRSVKIFLFGIIFRRETSMKFRLHCMRCVDGINYV